MIVDKPEWVQHGESPIYSIDIDGAGKRVATAGQDNRVRIWAMGPILDAAKELDPDNNPRLLATLTEHCGAVNVARFSKSGKFLASGADDKLVLVYQLLPGPGKTAFGSNEPPSVENWRQMKAMRGHSSNVADLAWSPDERMVASASLDNLVIIWDVEAGHALHQLKGHYGCVKGVAWDPFNHYLATQGEQDGIFIWRTENWSLVTKIKEPLGEMMGSSAMHYRLNWSPDGQVLAGTVAYDKPVHQAILIERNTWKSDFSYSGHRGAVCVAKFNPHLFFPRQKPDSDEATTLCALGSGDKIFTVWSQAEKMPLIAGKNFFKQGIMDVAWSPDGFTLLVCSYDGTVAMCRMDESELGKRVPKQDVEQLLQQLYGDKDARTAAKAIMTDYELAGLDAGLEDADAGEQQAAGPSAGTDPSRPPAAPSLAQPRSGVPPGLAKGNLNQIDKLSSRLGPGGASLGPANAAPAHAPATTATADGRKRVAPTPVGLNAMGAGPAGAMGAGGAAPSTAAPPAGRLFSPNKGSVGATRAATAAADGPHPKRQAVANAAAAPSAPSTAALASQPIGSQQQGGGFVQPALLTSPEARNLLAIKLGDRVVESGENLQGTQEVVELQACNTQRDFRGHVLCRLQCVAGGGKTLWYDHVQGAVLCMAGSLKFSAASTAHGDLLVFSAAGRRLLPPIPLGGPAAFMATDGHWRLMVMGVDARVRVWDMARQTCVLDASAAPIMASPGAEVASVRLLRDTGAAAIVMRNHCAYTFHQGMQAWVRVASDEFIASRFNTSFASSQGDLGSLQAGIAAARQPRAMLAAHMAPKDVLRREAVAHVEANVAGATALRSGDEWRRWLTTYVKLLAAEEDTARLREVMEELLGPMQWTPATHPSSPGELPPNFYAPAAVTMAAAAAAAVRAASSWWNPHAIPGLVSTDKRRFLRAVVLPELVRTRTPSNQKLAEAFLHQLKDAEAFVKQHEAQAQAGGAGGGVQAGGPGELGEARGQMGLGLGQAGMVLG